MQTITINSRKGGSGKTTTAHSLGAGLYLKGYRVLYVDLDSQGNLSYATGTEATEECNSFNFLKGKAVEPIKTPVGAVIPATDELSRADLEIANTGKEYRLQEALYPYSSMYDYCIVDTPAALGVLSINALTASQKVIIPTQAEIFGLQGIEQLQDAIQAVQKYCNRDLEVYGILLTRYQGRGILARELRETLETVADQMQTRLLEPPIRECTAIREAATLKQDIFSYAPRSNGARDYMEIVENILKGDK